MKKQITLGNNFKVDLPTLIETRLLIAANSGGGKSWALRKLLEETHGEVQQIVIDLEGEFYTLREKFDDYLLIGKGGDMPTQTRAAALLATKLLEINVSAIIDLSELKFHERKHFVRLFLESLIEAPEETRHPVMIVIDEAHHFAPQVGESEATGAVIDLMTRGRKRELCGVLATQRISKLHKDAIAECNNKMFGRTAQDIDVKRTSDELGFAKSAREAFETLRNLAAGEFFAFGTAIGSNVERYKVGSVQTTHFVRGKFKERKATPPKQAIKSMLEKLKDLPQEAEKKHRTEADLRKEIGILQGKITTLEKRPEHPTKIEKIEVPVVGKKTLEGLKKSESVIRKMLKGVEQTQALIADHVQTLEAALNKVATEIQKVENPRQVATVQVKEVVSPRKAIVNFPARPIAPFRSVEEGEIVLKKGAVRMLGVLVSRYPMKFTRSQWATLSDISARSGTFSSYLSALRIGGLIIEEGEFVYASQSGIDYLGGNVPDPQTPEEVRAMWRSKLKEGARRMFDVLAETYPNAVSRERLAELSNISVNSGTFSSYLSALRTNGLIDEVDRELRMSEDLFL